MSPRRPRSRTRLTLTGLAVTAVLGAAAVPAAPAHDDHPGRGNAADRWVARTLQRMTLEEKVGQLFLANVQGRSADTTDPAEVAANQAMYGPDVRNADDLIDKYKLGGIVYFRWTDNVDEPTQIAHLSNGIQAAARDQRTRIPMLISTDQEQGVVSRVWAPATEFPGNMALGAGRRPGDAFTSSNVTAQELAAVGINQNYAPDADVNVNPLNPVIGVRSFGEDPDLVSSMTAAAVRGTQAANVAATIKHFPGHGDTVTDSHSGVPWIFHTKEQWERIDAPPFRAGIAAGTDMVMTAHVVMPELQSDCDQVTQQGCDPATLDPEILTGLLRNELGYDGVVVTDALNMAGVREKYGDARVPVLALKAGVDLLMMIDTPTDTVSLDVAYRAVLDAVRSGEIGADRIDQSVRRVLALKWRRGLVRRPFVDERRAAASLGTPDHLAAARAVAGHGVTLIKNDAGLLPLAPDPGRRMLVTGYRSVSNTVDAAPAERLAAALRDRGTTTDLFETGAAPDQATIDAAVAKAADSDVVVVTTSNASGSAAQQRLVRALLATGRPVALVATRNPYDIAALTEAPTYLASYSWTTPAMDAVAGVLLGEAQPEGRLPVRIPAAGDPATTLYPYGYGLGL